MQTNKKPVSFIDRIKNGWRLTKQSLYVLKADKEILIFPVLSLICIIGSLALFVIFVLLGVLGVSLVNINLANGFLYLSLFLWLVLSYFIGLFFESAIIASATIRFSGKNPSFSDGFALPAKKVHRLLIWAFINAVVSTILNILNNLTKGKSRAVQATTAISTSIFGIAWNLMTFFVLPVILFEDKKTFESISRSKDLFIKTWGENVTAQVTASGLFFLAGIIGFIPLFISILTGNIAVITAFLILFMLWLSGLIIIATSVNGIIKASLYQYAITNKMPHIYDKETEIVITNKMPHIYDKETEIAITKGY